MTDAPLSLFAPVGCAGRLRPCAAACVTVAVMTLSTAMDAQSREPIRYTLRFPAPQTHYVEMDAGYPTDGRPQIDLFMAVWTPGRIWSASTNATSRTSAREARRGIAWRLQKSAKNRWRVETGGATTVTVSYRVYGREMTVRNNWIESAFAMLNGAPTFISLVERASRARTRCGSSLPAAWKTSATALMPVSGQPHTYLAEDFDTLVDSPIILGNRVRASSRSPASGTPWCSRATRRMSTPIARRPTRRRSSRRARDVMGGRVDYPHYYFLNMIMEAGGGLEHKNSFLGDGEPLHDPDAPRLPRLPRPGRARVLSQLEHQAAASRRARPVRLRERGLHQGVCGSREGFTDYYAGLLVKRAGLSTRDEFFEEMSGQIEAVQTTPGRLVTSVAMSSFDTWIKQYRPDENTPNTTVNYYPKGAVIAFLLDARIRDATGGAKSLDDAMRLAYAALLGPEGLHARSVLPGDERTAGTDLRPGLHARSRAPRNWTTRKRSTGSAFASARSTRAAAARGWASRRATTAAAWSSRRCAVTRPRSRRA